MESIRSRILAGVMIPLHALSDEPIFLEMGNLICIIAAFDDALVRTQRWTSLPRAGIGIAFQAASENVWWRRRRLICRWA